MKPSPHHQKIGIPALSLLALLLIFLPVRASGTPPAWWYERGVITTNPPADYTAITQGQLKYLATAAAAELDANADGGAGDTIHAMIASWSTPTTNTTDYNAVTLGQLKNVAQPFYDQLISIGYTDDYPWNTSANAPSDYNIANIGQAKRLFSFDLTATIDGVLAGWESYYGITDVNALALRGDGLSNLQAYRMGLNPNDYYNGANPNLSIVNGNNQTGPVNGPLPQPLIVSVTDGNGNPYIGAPVSFTTGAGTLQSGSTGKPGATITVLSDGSGLARAFLTLPNIPNAPVAIFATTGNAQTSFSEQSDNGSGTYVNPFAPSQVTANVNVDGSVDITWINNADPNDPRPIQVAYMDTNNTMQTITTVPAGSTSYHVPAQ